jgi:SOS-response transcriptional repressor LexA
VDEINKSYYAVIPAIVRYDEKLTPNAKLLYGEITALCNEKGYCWATNEYFSKLYKVSKKSISTWINQLSKKGYIKTTLIYKDGSKEIDSRYIQICGYPIEENFHTSLQKGSEPIEENFHTPMEEKVKENNTSFNNTFNKDISPSEDGPNISKYDEFVNLYEKTCTKLPKVAKLTTKRKTAINKLMKEMSLKEIEYAFKIINNSNFCNGINDRGWKADFDFCIRSDKLTNALEGKYSTNNFISSKTTSVSKYKEL